MSKDEFVLKINKVKVNFTDIKGGIKKEDIKDEKLKSIFDSIDTDDKKGVLSDDEVKTFFGLVQSQAQRHNSKNLGKREYKKLLKELENNGIKLEDVDKNTFLQFLSELNDAGKTDETDKQPKEENTQEQAKEDQKDKFILKINKNKVDFSDIKGGIKRYDIKDDTLKMIFDAIDTDNEKGVLSDDEINTFMELVQSQAQRHNSKNLGKREYKKLLKNLEEKGIKLENIDRKTFLEFLSNLKEASEKAAESSTTETPTAEFPKEAPQNQVSQQKQTKVIVQLGETPEQLAKKFGCSVEELKELNKDKLINNGSAFRAGDEIVIPREIPASELEGRKTSEEVNNEYARLRDSQRGVSDNKDNNTVVTEKAKKGKFTTAQIKVTIPVTKHSARTYQIDRYRTQGANLTASLNNNDTKGLSVQNIAYAFTSEVKFQDMNEETVHFVFKYLVQRLKDLGIFQNGKDYGIYNSFKKMSPNGQNKILREYRNRIVVFENNITKTDKARVRKANAERPKQQKVFDDANKFLVDVANGTLKTNIEVDDDGRAKTAKLNDGRKIIVMYDDAGEIENIYIYNSDNPDNDVFYDKNNACADTDHSNDKFEKTIKSGFNFAEIKKVAEAIFGKIGAAPAAPAPKAEETEVVEDAAPAEEAAPVEEAAPETEGAQTDSKFTTDQIKVTVPYKSYSETQIRQFMQEGEDIADGKKGIEALNPRNVAYSVKKYATKDMESIFKNLVARMKQLKIFEYGKDYGSFTTLSKLPAAKQTSIISAYAKRIRNVDNEHLNAGKEAKKQANVFFKANKFLVDMANDKAHLSAKIEPETEEKKAFIAELNDGRKIRIALDDNGEIIMVNIQHNGSQDQWDVEYSSSYAMANTDLNNDKYDGVLRSGFNFAEIKKVAETIFAEFLNKEK